MKLSKYGCLTEEDLEEIEMLLNEERDSEYKAHKPSQEELEDLFDERTKNK